MQADPFASKAALLLLLRMQPAIHAQWPSKGQQVAPTAVDLAWTIPAWGSGLGLAASIFESPSTTLGGALSRMGVDVQVIVELQYRFAVSPERPVVADMVADIACPQPSRAGWTAFVCNVRQVLAAFLFPLIATGAGRGNTNVNPAAAVVDMANRPLASRIDSFADQLGEFVYSRSGDVEQRFTYTPPVGGTAAAAAAQLHGRILVLRRFEMAFQSIPGMRA